MLTAQGMDAKVMAAPFTNVEQVYELIAAGIQAVTVQPPVVHAMIDHPGTEIAVQEFTATWERAYGRKTLRA